MEPSGILVSTHYNHNGDFHGSSLLSTGMNVTEICRFFRLRNAKSAERLPVNASHIVSESSEFRKQTKVNVSGIPGAYLQLSVKCQMGNLRGENVQVSVTPSLPGAG